MFESRRRSTRRVKKRTSAYVENDLVQVTKSNSMVIARLVAKVAETPAPRWLLTFDNYDDEEYPEALLGRVVGRMEEGEDDSLEREALDSATTDITVAAVETLTGGLTSKASEDVRNSKKRRSSSSTDRGPNNNNSSSGNNSPSDDKKKKKGVTFLPRSRSNSEVSSSLHTSTTKSEPMSASANTNTVAAMDLFDYHNSKVSDREQRSRRRQAFGQEEGLHAPDTSLHSGNNTNCVLPNNKSILSDCGTIAKRPFPGKNSTGGPSKKKAKGDPIGKDESEVLKVKLLTGTLFLYKGVHRHVEFIPRI